MADLAFKANFSIICSAFERKYILWKNKYLINKKQEIITL